MSDLPQVPADASDADETSVETPAPVTAPPKRPLRVIAVGGAKGGVGKTVFATNLALYLATIGRRVIVADADASGANVHTLLGVDRAASKRVPGGMSTSYGPESWSLIDTPVPGLRLLDLALDEPASGALRTRRRVGLLEKLRKLDADYVVVDLGAGTGHTVVDLYLGADVSALVTLPEPTAIDSTYRLLRAAFARRVRNLVVDRAERRAVQGALRDLGAAPSPPDLLAYLDRTAPSVARVARAELASFHPRILLNQTRVRADLELGDAMRSAVRRKLGIVIDYLGHIDFDDTVWSCVRARRPLLVESPGTKASKSIEKIARRLLAVDHGKARIPSRTNAPPETFHDLLEVDRGATDEEVRRAFKRAKEIYASDALCCYGLFEPNELAVLHVRLEEAYDVLLDPARRRPYELSVFPPEPDPAAIRPEPADSNDPKPPAPDITPETEFTGQVLRQVRESQGFDLSDIVRTTKISPSYLRAIEEDDFRALPALVYVRGFVTEMAKFLKLDASQVSRTYVRRYRRYLDERPKL